MKKTLLFLIFFLQFFSISAQNPAQITHAFGSYPGFNDNITCIKQQSDGKILVGGRYTCYQGALQNRLIRLNADGSKDVSFDIGSGFNYDVEDILIQPDGKILVCGRFSKFQDSSQRGLIRLNADGSNDKSFDIGSGGNDVYSLGLQSNGKIIIAGGFQVFNGYGQRNIIRLNSNGSIDISLKISSGFYHYVDQIIIQPDGKILAKGNFTSPQREIVRLNTDGSQDVSFDIGTGFEGGNLKSIALQSDGKVIVFGTFTKYQGNKEIGLIRLHSDGSKDNSFDTGDGFHRFENNDDNSYYYGSETITVQPDRKIIVMGNFTSYQGVDVNGLIRLNEDGSRDNSFDIGKEFNNDPKTSKALALQYDGQLLVGWEIITNQGINQNHIIRLDTDGTKNPSLEIGNGLNFPVNSMVKQKDGKIIAGGNFTAYKGVSQNNLIRFNSDKTKDNSFSIGSGFNGTVNTIALQNDGKIIVGGNFTKYKEANQNYLIRLNADGTKDPSFDIGIGFNKSINFITIQPDGKILVGGNFLTYQGIIDNHLVRLNIDGTRDTTFNTETGFYTPTGDNLNVVKTIALQSDGKILVGGDFDRNSSTNESNLIRLNKDGTIDKSFNVGTGFSSTVFSLTLQPDQKIIVGGAFSSYQKSNVKCLLLLNTDGSIDNSFDAGLTFQDCMVYTTVLQNDGKIVVGSYSSSEQRISQNNLVRLNTDGSRDNSFGKGITFFNNFNYASKVYSILLQPDDQLLIGGEFTAYQGNNLSAYLIEIPGNAPNLSGNEFNIQKKSFSVWPNPVKNTLNINSLNESNYSVKIYDLFGRLIYTKENVNTSIDVSSFTSGLYLIKIKAENGEASQKFIKI